MFFMEFGMRGKKVHEKPNRHGAGRRRDDAVRSKPKQFYRGCLGKKPYSSKAIALSAARAILVELDTEQKPYKCRVCSRWHLTTVTP